MDGSGSVMCVASTVILVDMGSKTFIRLVFGPLLPKATDVCAHM